MSIAPALHSQSISVNTPRPWAVSAVSLELLISTRYQLRHFRRIPIYASVLAINGQSLKHAFMGIIADCQKWVIIVRYPRMTLLDFFHIVDYCLRRVIRKSRKRSYLSTLPRDWHYAQCAAHRVKDCQFSKNHAANLIATHIYQTIRSHKC